MVNNQNKTNIALVLITIVSIIFWLLNFAWASYSDKSEEIANAILAWKEYKYSIARQLYTEIDKYNSTIVWTCEQLPSSMKVDCSSIALTSELPSRAEVGEHFKIEDKSQSNALPPRTGTWDKGIPIVDDECNTRPLTDIVGVELHYTATDTWTQLKSILNGHKARFGSDYIGYHYVINYWGEVYNTRADKCVAMADKENHNNWKHIQVSFIWKDKPSPTQKEALGLLIIKLSKTYNFPITSVTSHHDEASYKSSNESLDYWFGGKEKFIEYIKTLETKTPAKQEAKAIGGKVLILRNWWNDPRVQYGYEISNGDMDFIRTIEAESKWDTNAVGDSWNSFWLCQFHKGFNPWLHKEYKALGSDKEKVKFCYDYYLYARGLPKWVGSRLHGYNVRNLNQNVKPFVIVKE